MLQIDLSSVEGARLWWLTRMLFTRRPLLEKMALFWHNHFATASSKVRLAPLILQQRSRACPGWSIRGAECVAAVTA
jgi:uncharacterized protein (DUF1800 family)